MGFLGNSKRRQNMVTVVFTWTAKTISSQIWRSVARAAIRVFWVVAAFMHRNFW